MGEFYGVNCTSIKLLFKKKAKEKDPTVSTPESAEGVLFPLQTTRVSAGLSVRPAVGGLEGSIWILSYKRTKFTV